MKDYIIIDWANNVCFKGEMFESFDDAEDFLSEKLGDNYEEERGEYYIGRLENMSKKDKELLNWRL